MKVNLPIFKDESMKDVVTYCNGMWPTFIDLVGMIRIYFLTSSTHCKDFWVTLPRSLGKDATLSDVLQTLGKHYGVTMTFSALSKELYSLKQGIELEHS